MATAWGVGPAVIFPGSGVDPLEITNSADFTINPDEYGIAQGASVLRPTSQVRTDWTLTGATAGPNKETWANLVGSVNNADYVIDGVTYNAGEVLFMGFHGSVTYGSGDERHSFEFALQKNIPEASPVVIYGVSG